MKRGEKREKNKLKRRKPPRKIFKRRSKEIIFSVASNDLKAPRTMKAIKAKIIASSSNGQYRATIDEPLAVIMVVLKGMCLFPVIIESVCDKVITHPSFSPS